MKSSNYKYPLLINLFWDNNSPLAHELAQQLYHYFYRVAEQPLDRHLNIPVHRFTKVPEIKELELAGSAYCANVFLIDEKMVLNSDWKQFHDKLKKSLKNKKQRIYLAALCNGGHKFGGNAQSYRLPEKINDREAQLKIQLTHDLARLINSKSFASAKVPDKNNPPVKLFISHAKQDGKQWAQELKDRIDETPNLESFMDAFDIPGGENFIEEFKSNIREAILVILHTDLFSTREWCRKEVLMAKKYKRPIIVFNRLRKGEKRSFPYLGNTTHIRYQKKSVDKNESLDNILLEAIKEVLRVKHQEITIEMLSKLSNKSLGTALIYPPELISVLDLPENKQKVVLYPDPPIGKEELQILAQVRPLIEFATPTLLPLISKDRKEVISLPLKVAISLSEVNNNETSSFHNEDIKNLMVEIARYLLVAGIKLNYGGRIGYDKKENFTKLLVDLLVNYKNYYEDTDQKKLKVLDNYSGFPLSTLINDKYRAKSAEYINIIEVPPPKELKVEDKHGPQILKCDTLEKNYVWAKSMSAMRNCILNNSDALIVLGGKNFGFKSKMPGVLEETLLALNEKKSVYILGGFGGVAGAVASALQGRQPETFTNAFFEEQYNSYVDFMNFYNEYSLTSTDERVNYQICTQTLNKYGKSSDDFGLNNGLSKSENKRLFNSRNEIEIIHLLLKGLNTLTK